MRKAKEITKEIACQFTCNPKTGILIWNVNKRRVKKGRIVAGKYNGGYLRAGVDGDRYLAHRICYFIYHGVNPKGSIDHINHNPSDNRKENLRECNHNQNLMNQKKNKSNTSGYVGVICIKATNKWKAYINVNYKQISLGHFKNIKNAIKARKDAEKLYFKEYRFKGELTS